jgi:hypothetical protein
MKNTFILRFPAREVAGIGLALVAILFFSACSGNGGGVAASGKADVAVASGGGSGDSTYSGDNMFSYSFNGRKVTIRDIMHAGDGKNRMALYLNHVTNDAGMLSIEITNQLSAEVFNLTIPNSGTTRISHYSPSLSNFRDKKSASADFMSHYKNYYADDVTVTVTDINATHVAGTFSGKYLSDDDKPVPMEVTDGKFDLRFTKPEGN